MTRRERYKRYRQAMAECYRPAMSHLPQSQEGRLRVKGRGISPVPKFPGIELNEQLTSDYQDLPRGPSMVPAENLNLG